jgi:hypothetical protein
VEEKVHHLGRRVHVVGVERSKLTTFVALVHKARKRIEDIVEQLQLFGKRIILHPRSLAIFEVVSIIAIASRGHAPASSQTWPVGRHCSIR